VFVFGALSFTWIQTLADESREQAEDNCHAAEDFRSLLANSRTYELRELQARRNHLADESATVESRIVRTAGFRELPESLQRFLLALVEAQVADARQQLAEYDEQLRLGRAELDLVRQFVLAVDCPGEAPPVVPLPPIPTVTLTPDTAG
jgi:hypothetical protein